jgi:asparagine synthase (glutamine-hydrolysing)
MMQQLDERGGPAAWLAAYGDAVSVGLAAPNGSGERATAGPRGRALALLAAPASWAPAVAEREGCHALFDGTLYNRAELQAHFAGQLPPEPSDAALVAAGYERWGEDLPRHLKGLFALVIWDRARDTLLCARDPMGIHPLFYADVGGTLLLSPAIHTLLGHPGVSSELNRAALVDHLLWRWTEPEETHFAHVRRLLPGRVLRVDSHGRRVALYWDPVAPDQPFAWVPDDEVQDRFDALVEQAIDRRLSVGAPGIFLSGGIDSVGVAVLTTAQRERAGQPPPWALAMGFAGGTCDEEPMQRAVASALGLPFCLFQFYDAASPDDYITTAMAASAAMPAPLYDLFGPAYARLALEGQRRGCEVILTGEGGDEWLGVTSPIAADLLRSLNVVGTYRLWHSYARSNPFPSGLILRNILWYNGARPLARDAWHVGIDRVAGLPLVGRVARGAREHHRTQFAARLAAIIPPWIAPDPALRAQVVQRLEAHWEAGQAARRDVSFYQREVRDKLDDVREWMKAEESFWQGRRLGIPIHHPLLDADLVELLIHTRPHVRSRGDFSKALLRERVARRLPGLGFERQRKGNHLDFYLRCIEVGLARARAAIGNDWALAALGVLDPARLDVLLDDPVAVDGRRAWGRVREILTAEAWVRARDRPSRATAQDAPVSAT